MMNGAGTLERARKSPVWKERAARNTYQDVYLGSAEFSQFLVKRLAEYKEFYDGVGLGGK
jgi:tripartite-type tricarboxylate transporter receptor subunit TctC